MIHRVVVDEASLLLTEDAKRQLALLMGPDALSTWADWADRSHVYPKKWHYVRLDAVGKPCVGMAENIYCALMWLMDPNTPIPEVDRVRLLIHLVVDAHQPLHVDSVFPNTTCRVRAPKRTSLHAWTDADAAGSRDEGALRKNIKRLRARHDVQVADPETWLRESAALWSVIYPPFYGKIPYYCRPHARHVPLLSSEDRERIEPVMLFRLAEASVRLASVLNQLYG